MTNVLLAIPLFATALSGADVVGRWTGTIDVPDTGSGTVISTQVEASFERRSGKLEGKIGRRADANGESVRHAVLDGKTLTFEVLSPETASAMRFTLSVEGDRIAGEMKGKVDGAGDIVGRVALVRAAAQGGSAPKPNIVLVRTGDSGLRLRQMLRTPDIATPTRTGRGANPI
ncbi:MAG: hypothetical protein EXQ52_11425 [Bryobacterales bacterium]|nr:hypothetical protein [Bryobacterales bacterium]